MLISKLYACIDSKKTAVLYGLLLPRKAATLIICILVVAGLTALRPCAIEAAEITARASVGYDANPAQEKNGKGSGFAGYAFGLTHRFNLFESVDLEILPDLEYQDLWDGGDNHRISLEMVLLPAASNKRFLPYVFAGAKAVRDQLVPIDEHNEFGLGAGADWLISSRYTLGIEVGWHSLNYLSDAYPFAHGPQNQNTGQGLQNGMQNGMQNGPVPGQSNSIWNQPVSARNDDKLSAGLDLDIFIIPSLSWTIGLDYVHLDSSLEMESYWQISPTIKLYWSFLDQWRLFVKLMWERKEYPKIQDTFPDNTNVSRSKSAQIQVSRFFGNLEVFTKLLLERGDYVDQESYHQKVIQCGISLSF